MTCGLNTKPAELKVSPGAPTTPLPDKVTYVVAKLFVLLFTYICPLNAPFSVGRNAIFTVQVAFVASDVGHVFVCAKLLLMLNGGLLNVRLVVAALPTVTVWYGLAVSTLWFAKVKLVGLKVRRGWLTPVPVRFTMLGLLLPPCTIVRVPGRDAAVVGLNVTVMAHSLPPARLEPQVFVSE